MTQTIILIGKNRRITLDELYSLSRGEAKLEMVIHGRGGGGDENTNQTENETIVADDDDQQQQQQKSSSSAAAAALVAAMNDLSLNVIAATEGRGGQLLLSQEATIASLALLSLALSQGRIIRDAESAFQLSSALVDLVNIILLLFREEEEGEEKKGDQQSRTAIALPANGAEFASSVNALLLRQGAVLLPSAEDKPYLARLILLARVSLMLAQGT